MRIPLVMLLLTMLACHPRQRLPDHFDDGRTLAGEWVTAEQLNRGRELYMLNCYACHGVDGDGRGPAAGYLRPRPRDFRLGEFKFGGNLNPGLPHTEDLVALVKRGLSGTAMLPWDLPDNQVEDIIQYIKTLSPVWAEEEAPAARVLPSRDPWLPSCADVSEHRSVGGCAQQIAESSVRAVAAGERAYHLDVQCAKCHPAYMSQGDFWQLAQAANKMSNYYPLLYRSGIRDSSWETETVFVDKDGKTQDQDGDGQPDKAKVSILPIDFLFHSIKTLHPEDDVFEERERLYRVIKGGIGGTPMPNWETQPEDLVWSLTYYVQHLYQQRGTAEARALRRRLAQQAPFVPPETTVQ